MPTTAPSCSVYACHEAATFVLLNDDTSNLSEQILVDCLCATHWLQLRLHDSERAYRYVPIRYASVTDDVPTPEPKDSQAAHE